MNKDFLEKCLKDINVEYNQDIVNDLLAYMSRVLNVNQNMNLTSIKDEKDFIIKNIIDSLILTKYIPNNSKIIDIGTGAGFPGSVLKLYDRTLDFTFVDSVAKKLNFVKEALVEMDVANIDFSSQRAEELSRNSAYRERYDICVSRAVASLPILCELCIPFIKVGGYFIAQKSRGLSDELKLLGNGYKKLGCVLEKVDSDKLPFDDYERNTVLFKKVKQTDNLYPRRYAQIRKMPIK